ncbi:LPD29 domain-containing protein [Streptomyces chryseus]|uniref:LPD29 domain-containing protein n=1 Tax=Streptomyces chryseus TaxID=68186 RepID=UPI00110FA564|nr:LPD29 domain-containing protein [Streptomyces chryseus]
MTTYIDARYVSAELKRRLIAAFPGAKFSVRRGKGTGSASIDVTWADGPTDADVAAIARPMQGSSWNGYEDRYESTGNEVTVTIDGKRVTGKPVVDHIGLHHEVSDEVRAEALALWKSANGEDTDTEAQNGGFTCEGEFIGGSWGVNQVLDIARKVVLPRRWKGAQEAAPAGTGLVVTYTEEEGIVVRGTRRGDGSAPVLRDADLKWHRKEGYWYLPGTRGEAGAERLEDVRDALRAAGLLPAPTGVLEAAPAADPVEEVAGEEPTEAAAEEQRGLEAGAHRVTNTGEGQSHGAGTAYVFRCLVCEQRASLVEFDGLKCTEAAEAEHARTRADGLLDDVILRGAGTYVITYALAKKPVQRTRDEAVEDLARLLVLGASHRWYTGELRLMHHGYQVASVKRPPGEPLAARTAPQTYRCVPVPEEFAADWDGVACLAWRDGVDAALTYAVLARSGS